MAGGVMMHGARARFTIEGKLVAMATGVSVREIQQVQRAKTMDSIRTAELVVTDYEVSIDIDMIRAVGKSPVAQGLFPKKGKTADEHLRNIVEHPDMVAVIEDKISGKRLETISGLVAEGYNRSYRRTQVSESSISFQAIVATDDAEAAEAVA
jgi:transcriptional regulator with XRE-family HTH domain